MPRVHPRVGFLVSLAVASCQFQPTIEGTPPVERVACMNNPAYDLFRSGHPERYRRVADALAYDRAYAECSRDGAHLAVIDDADENAFLYDVAQATFWVGLNDLVTDGLYQWVNGRPFDFQRWNPGQPSGGDDEDCVRVIKIGGGEDAGWHDYPCATELAYFCECTPEYEAPPVPACMADVAYAAAIDGRRYRYEGTLVTWDEARESCAEAGGHLAAASDLHENGEFAALQGAAGEVWLGYTDRDQEGVFTWINGATTVLDAWDVNEPSNSNGGEHCVELRGDNSRWNDQRCEDGNTFICECDPGFVP